MDGVRLPLAAYVGTSGATTTLDRLGWMCEPIVSIAGSIAASTAIIVWLTTSWPRQVRYILWLVGKYDCAQHLVDEMAG